MLLPRKVTPALFAAAALAGCAALPISPNLPSDEPWTNYAIGRVQSAATGSTMIEWIGRAQFLRGYRMVQSLNVERIGRQPPQEDTVWPARYTYHGPCKGGRYLITNPAYYAEQIGIIVGDDGTIPCALSVLQIGGNCFKRGRQWQTPDAVGMKVFVPVPVVAGAAGDPIKWELIYSGRSGNEIGLAYREYASGPGGTFARPAFYQELKYDLGASNRVVFQSTEIEILDASNAGVRFRVLRDAERAVSEPGSSLAPRGR